MADRLARFRAIHIALLVLAISAILRSSTTTYTVMDIDDAHLWVMGRTILDGGLPYIDSANHKPPLLWYLSAGLVALTRGKIVAVNVLMYLWLAVTGTFLFLAMRRLLAGSASANAAAAASALVYAFLASSNVVTTNGELLMDLPLSISLLWFARGAGGRRWSLLAAGLFVGIAVLIRPQAAINIAAYCISLLLLRPRGERGAALLEAVVCGVGFAVPVLAAALAFHAAGLFAEFWRWNITLNLSYPAPYGWPRAMLEGVAGFALGGQLGAWILSVGRGRDLLRPRASGARPGADLVLGAVLLALAMIAVCQGRRFYDHYFIQLAMPLAILSGPRVVALAASTGARARWTLRVAIVLIVCSGVVFGAIGWVRGALGHYPEQDPKAVAVADYINKSVPPGRILLWGDASQIYYATRRMPGTRFFFAAPVVGNFDSEQVPDSFDVTAHVVPSFVEQMIEDIHRLQPIVVVDSSTGPIHSWHRFSLAKVEALRAVVERDYELMATVQGVRIYSRRTGDRSRR